MFWGNWKAQVRTATDSGIAEASAARRAVIPQRSVTVIFYGAFPLAGNEFLPSVGCGVRLVGTDSTPSHFIVRAQGGLRPASAGLRGDPENQNDSPGQSKARAPPRGNADKSDSLFCFAPVVPGKTGEERVCRDLNNKDAKSTKPRLPLADRIGCEKGTSFARAGKGKDH